MAGRSGGTGITKTFHFRTVTRRSVARDVEDIIVGDARQFLSYLERREEIEGVRIPHLNTGGLIVESSLCNLLSKPQALEALDRIRPRMPERHDHSDLQVLENYGYQSSLNPPKE